MNKASRTVQRTYLILLLFNTLAASLIWGINTLFLLDAGLNNTEAFAANAFCAMEAWLVDALAHSGFKEPLESVLSKGEIV